MGSLRRDIYDAFVTALNKITTANGYENDVGPSGAQKVGYLQDDTERPYVVLTFLQEDKEVESQQRYMCELRFQIFCYSDEVNEGDTESIEDEIDKLVSDVELLILTEMDSAPIFGIAQVQDIRLDGHAKYEVGHEVVQGAEVYGTIIYFHNIDAVDT